MRKIKIRKNLKVRFLKFAFLLVFLIVITITFLLTDKIKLYKNNEVFVTNMLDDYNHYDKYKNKHIISSFINYVYQINLREPLTLLENVFKYDTQFDEDYNPDELEKVSKYITDPNPTLVDKPIVYIYNSHQLENYSNTNFEIYNITPNVMMASYMLKEKLNDLGISTLVEDGNITEFMRINNWNYNYSYLASRYFINSSKEKNPTLKYYIDIHRDSISKENSTTLINNKLCAKVLFVVGLEHDDYQYNLDLANYLNELIKRKYHGLTRGVLKKSGPNVNGIYNQDISHNSILIEIGGQDNKIEEVYNTIDILSEVLKEAINERG